jgi:hypothetical protein
MSWKPFPPETMLKVLTVYYYQLNAIDSVRIIVMINKNIYNHIIGFCLIWLIKSYFNAVTKITKSNEDDRDYRFTLILKICPRHFVYQDWLAFSSHSLVGSVTGILLFTKPFWSGHTYYSEMRWLLSSFARLYPANCSKCPKWIWLKGFYILCTIDLERLSK